MAARRCMADADFPAQLAQRKVRRPAHFQRHFGCLEQSLAQIPVMIRTRIRLQLRHSNSEPPNCSPVSQKISKGTKRQWRFLTEGNEASEGFYRRASCSTASNGNPMISQQGHKGQEDVGPGLHQLA